MEDLITSIKEELNIHKEVRVISFDIFDTLLFRMVRKPDAVFEIVGRKAVESGILPEHITPVVYLPKLIEIKIFSKYDDYFIKKYYLLHMYIDL